MKKKNRNRKKTRLKLSAINQQKKQQKAKMQEEKKQQEAEAKAQEEKKQQEAEAKAQEEKKQQEAEAKAQEEKKQETKGQTENSDLTIESIPNRWKAAPNWTNKDKINNPSITNKVSFNITNENKADQIKVVERMCKDFMTEHPNCTMKISGKNADLVKMMYLECQRNNLPCTVSQDSAFKPKPIQVNDRLEDNPSENTKDQQKDTTPKLSIS